MFVRPLTAAERQALTRGLESADAVTPRRSQARLAGAGGMGPAGIGRLAGGTAPAARDITRAFHAGGTGCPKRESSAPSAAWDRGRGEGLEGLLHRRPRAFGKPTGPRTPGPVAEVRPQGGWTARVPTAEAIRLTLERVGVGRERAGHGITSPAPEYAEGKGPGPADPAGRRPPGLGARVPGRGVVGAAGPTRPGRPGGRRPAPAGGGCPGPGGGGRGAPACYGVLRLGTGGMVPRLAEGRPAGATAEDPLGWACERLAAEGEEVFAPARGDAARHAGERARRWVARHDRRVRRVPGPGARAAGDGPVPRPDRAEVGPRHAGRRRARPEAHPG